MTEREIPTGWIKTTLGEVADFSQGFQVSTDFQYSEQKEGFVRFVRIVDYTNEGETPRYIENPNRCFVNEDDLVMIRYGSQTAGKIVRWIAGVIANNTFQIKPQESIDKDWIYWFLRQNSIYQFLNKDQSSSTMPAITFTQVGKLEISIPPFPEQQAIASMLSAFDDKIELLREQNETLEQMGQELFKEWFGRYSPDRPEELSEGWRVGKITEIINREIISYKCTKKDLDEKGTTQIFDQWETGIYWYTNREPDFIASRENPVLLFTNHTCNYRFVDYSFCAIQNVIPYRWKWWYDEYFLYFMTKWSITFIEYKWHRPDFEVKDFIIPTVEKAQEFSKIAKPLLEKISDNNIQIKSLSKTRDTLLPKLMSGEVRVEF